MLGPLRRAWQRKVDDWMRRHHPRRAGPYRINRRRIYILPSRAGWGYGAGALIVLLAAMNYSNSLGFMLAFWMAAVGFVAMHETHANLLGIEVRLGPPEPVFAGEAAHQPVHLRNSSRKARTALTISQDRLAEVAAEISDCDSEAHLYLRWTPQARGVHRPPRFALSSDWPLGLFRAWSWVHLAQDQVVYPKPAAGGGEPPHSSHDPAGEIGLKRGQEELAGLREYVQGDNPRHIHWRSLAAHDQLASKNFADPRSEVVWLDLAATPGHDLEERLSLLCRWVMALHGRRQPFGLALGATRIPPGLGDGHRDQCLEALARHGQG